MEILSQGELAQLKQVDQLIKFKQYELEQFQLAYQVQMSQILRAHNLNPNLPHGIDERGVITPLPVPGAELPPESAGQSTPGAIGSSGA